VRVIFDHSGGSNLNESGTLEFLKVSCPAIAHPGAKAPDQLIQNLRNKAFERYAA
jgi:hypothetical protein